MAITYSTAIQDKVAFRVYNLAYSSLNAAQKKKLDGNTTPPADPGGVVGEALTQVQQYAQYFQFEGATAAPPQWEHWLVAESSYLLSLTEKPQSQDELDQARERAKDRALETFSLLTASESSDSTGYVLTKTSIRRSCFIRAVRNRPRFFPQVESIDEAIHEAIVDAWRNDWSFSRQQVTATINTDGTVTVNLASSESFEYVLTRKWYYKNTSGSNDYFDQFHDGFLSWADADKMAELKAATLTAGKPRFFRMIQAGDTKTWILDRTPDQAYTIYGEAKFKQPTLDSPDDVDAALVKFPSNFKPTIRDMIWARVLRDYGNADQARELEDRISDRQRKDLPEFDDQGNADRPLEVVDMYQDRLYQGNSGMIGGAM